MFKVLLVEDNSGVRLILGKQLRHEGLTVVSAETGDEAQLLATKNKDFDVAVVDLVLPGKLQGLKLVRSLREACPGIGVVQMSGEPRQIDDMETDNCFDRVLRKPVRRLELIEAVNYAYQARSILRRRCS